MKKILIAWIAVFVVACIVAKFVARRPEKGEIATVTPKVAKVVIPEKEVKAVERPRIIERIVRVETEKPEDVVRLEAKMDELKKEIEAVETLLRQTEFQPREIRRYEAEEPLRVEPQPEPEEEFEKPSYYWKPFVFPFIWVDLAINPFWYGYCWDWYYTGLYCYSYLWGWHPLWSWTRPFCDTYYPYYGYYSAHSRYGYDPFYRGGRTTIHKNQLKDPHYQFQGPQNPIRSSGLIQTTQLSGTNVKEYPSRIQETLKTSSNTGRFESPWGNLNSLRKSSAFSKNDSPWGDLKRFSGSSPKKSLDHSYSLQSVGSLRSFSGPSFSKPSSSFRSSPSRSSGTIRRK